MLDLKRVHVEVCQKWACNGDDITTLFLGVKQLCSSFSSCQASQNIDSVSSGSIYYIGSMTITPSC